MNIKQNMRMRRATHLYCHKCKTNLYDYGQKTCDACNGDLTTKGSKCSLNTIIEEEKESYLFKLNKIFCFCCFDF